MTTALDALHQAQAQGIRLWVDAGSIRYTPKDAPTDIIEELRQHKLELMAFLSLRREQAQFLKPCIMCGSHLRWRRVEDNAAL